MTHLIVLFNLKPGASPQAYEDWARRTDIPNVRALDAIAGFEVYKTLSVRGSDRAPPYQYVELISISNMERFGKEVASETMQRVASEFRAFADSPIFVVAENIAP